MAIHPDELRERLKALDARLGAIEIESLIPHLVEHRLAAGDVLVAEGSLPRTAWITWEGELVIRTRIGGKDIELARPAVGELVGEVSFLDAGPATASVVAAGDATVLTLSRDSFDTLARIHPHAAMELFHAITRTLARRMRTATDRLESLRSGGSVPPRHGILDAFRSLLGMGLS